MEELEAMEKKFRKHLGYASEIELDAPDGSKDKFKVSPLDPERLPDLYKSFNIFTEVTKFSDLMVKKEEELTDEEKENLLGGVLNLFEKLDKETLDRIGNLGLSTLKPNYPNIDDKLLKGLVMKNTFQFLMHLWTENMQTQTKTMDRERMDRLKRLQKRVSDAKSKGNDSQAETKAI